MTRHTTTFVTIVLAPLLGVSQQSTPLDETQVTRAGAIAVGADTENASMSDSDLSAVLDAAIHNQKMLENLTAAFTLTVVEHIEHQPADYVASRPELAFNGGAVTGTMKWWRNGDRERLDSTYNVPKEFKRNAYEDTVLFNDGEKQINYICRTRQAAVVAPGLLRGISPADWLLPGSRRGIEAFREDGRFDLFGAYENSGNILLRVTKDNSPVFEMTLAPELNYSVIAWNGHNGTSRGTVTYSLDDRQQPIPKQAEIEIVNAESLPVRKLSLRTDAIKLGIPEDNFDFHPPQGTLVADNRIELYGGEIAVYEISESGALVKVPAISMAPSPTLPGRSGIAWGAVLAALVALGFRIIYARFTHQ